MRGDEVKEMKSKGPGGKAWKAAGPCSAFLIILIFSSIVVIVVMRNICMKTGSLFIVSVVFFQLPHTVFFGAATLCNRIRSGGRND